MAKKENHNFIESCESRFIHKSVILWRHVDSIQRFLIAASTCMVRQKIWRWFTYVIVLKLYGLCRCILGIFTARLITFMRT